jgi:hypothetical protein
MDKWKDRIATIVAILGLYGAVAFGAQRVAYERFYEPFGVSPEDVGTDSTAILQQTAAGLVSAEVILVGVVAIVAVGLTVLGRRFLKGKVKAERNACVALVILASGCLGLTYVVIHENYTNAAAAAQCAIKEGRPVRGLRYNLPLVGITVTRLGVRADLARIRSTSPSTALPAKWKTRVVLYLGSANSLAAAYDRQKKQTVRFPLSSAVVRADTTTPLFVAADGCKPLA